MSTGVKQLRLTFTFLTKRFAFKNAYKSFKQSTYGSKSSFVTFVIGITGIEQKKGMLARVS
jgi:hypothetical protein